MMLPNIDKAKSIRKGFIYPKIIFPAVGALLLVTQTGCSQHRSNLGMYRQYSGKPSVDDNRSNISDRQNLSAMSGSGIDLMDLSNRFNDIVLNASLKLKEGTDGEIKVANAVLSNILTNLKSNKLVLDLFDNHNQCTNTSFETVSSCSPSSLYSFSTSYVSSNDLEHQRPDILPKPGQTLKKQSNPSSPPPPPLPAGSSSSNGNSLFKSCPPKNKSPESEVVGVSLSLNKLELVNMRNDQGNVISNFNFVDELQKRFKQRQESVNESQVNTKVGQNNSSGSQSCKKEPTELDKKLAKAKAEAEEKTDQ